MRFGIVVFPGTNCDTDTYEAVRYLGHQAEYVWHKESTLDHFDVVVLPGGFSYGDYLRCGAIARFSPVMKAVEEFAGAGGLVLGICNGFQILLEAGLLPGAMLANKGQKFICSGVHLLVENDDTAFTKGYKKGQVLRIPINHYEGNYFIDAAGLDDLRANDQVVLRYCDAEGQVSQDAAPNGALDNIAGICNREGNVFGLMPHPERAVEAILGSTDGASMLGSIAVLSKAAASE